MPSSSKVGAKFGKRSVWALAALAATLAVAAWAALAVAKTAPTTVKTAHNSSVGATILVDPHGMTLYELKPETAKPLHLLCVPQICLDTWPPLTTSKTAKLTKPAGVKGKLGKLHRAGFYQVTLDGRPLYHFKPDMAKGDAKGNGIHFPGGGLWHVVKVGAASKGTSTTTTTSTASTTSSSSSSTSPYPY